MEKLSRDSFFFIRQSGCSAVGSALRSGRRGRAFESPHPDKERQAMKIACRSCFYNTTNGLVWPIRTFYAENLYTFSIFPYLIMTFLIYFLIIIIYFPIF